jgi:hypothetical protein
MVHQSGYSVLSRLLQEPIGAMPACRVGLADLQEAIRGWVQFLGE